MAVSEVYHVQKGQDGHWAWPQAKITLRQGARVVKRELAGIKSPAEAGLRTRDSERDELTRRGRRI
jgi:hypothetical protein